MTQKSAKSLDNRLFFQTLSVLSATELKAFKTFCKQSLAISPQTKKLLVFVAKAHPEFGKLTEQQVFTKFFLNDSTASTLFNYALHDLYGLLRKWLIQKELEEDQYLQNQLYIRACKKRFLHQQFFKKTEKMLKVLEIDFLPIPDTWYKLLVTNQELFYHVQTDKNQEKVAGFTEMRDHLDLFYYGKKIRWLCQKFFRSQQFKNWSDLDKKDLAATLEFADKYGQNIPYFALYAQLVRHLQQPEPSTLSKFIQEFKRDRTSLDRLNQSLLLSLAIYSLNGATRKNNKIAMQIQFDLCKYAFDHDLVMTDNEMAIAFFNNFLIVACMLGELEVADKMLKKYTPYFNPIVRDEFVNLMRCTIFFYQKKYSKVEVNLHKFQFKESGFRIRSRNLSLKNHYERYQQDATLKPLLLSELVKLKKYVQKQNNLSDFQKNSYFAMIKVLRKLTNARHNRIPYRIKVKQELLNFMQDNKGKVISADWLLEKIAML